MDEKRKCMLIVIAAVLIHLIGLIWIFGLQHPPFSANYLGCDFWSLAQSGMDIRQGAGVYVPDDLHPVVWGPNGFPYVLPPWIAFLAGVPYSFLSPMVALIIHCLLLEACLIAVAFLCWKIAGKGLRGALAASLCFLAAPQLTVLMQGQTDTFICLGASLLIWSLAQGRAISRYIGFVLLVGIKPLGLFVIPSMLLNRKSRMTSLLVTLVFLVLIVLAIWYTIYSNPGMIQSRLSIFSDLKPGETAYSLEIQRPQYDYVFQFVKFLTLGRSSIDGPLNMFLAVDQSFSNLMRVLGIKWNFIASIILIVGFYSTWLFRKNSNADMVSLWILLALFTIPVVWDTYFLIVLPVAAYISSKRKDILPLVLAFVLVLPNLRWIEDRTAVLSYPLPSDYIPMILINLFLRVIALGWLVCLTWQMIYNENRLLRK